MDNSSRRPRAVSISSSSSSSRSSDIIGASTSDSTISTTSTAAPGQNTTVNTNSNSIGSNARVSTRGMQPLYSYEAHSHLAHTSGLLESAYSRLQSLQRSMRALRFEDGDDSSNNNGTDGSTALDENSRFGPRHAAIVLSDNNNTNTNGHRVTNEMLRQWRFAPTPRIHTREQLRTSISSLLATIGQINDLAASLPAYVENGDGNASGSGSQTPSSQNNISTGTATATNTASAPISPLTRNRLLLPSSPAVTSAHSHTAAGSSTPRLGLPAIRRRSLLENHLRRSVSLRDSLSLSNDSSTILGRRVAARMAAGEQNRDRDASSSAAATATRAGALRPRTGEPREPREREPRFESLRNRLFNQENGNTNAYSFYGLDGGDTGFVNLGSPPPRLFEVSFPGEAPTPVHPPLPASLPPAPVLNQHHHHPRHVGRLFAENLQLSNARGALGGSDNINNANNNLSNNSNNNSNENRNRAAPYAPQIRRARSFETAQWEDALEAAAGGNADTRRSDADVQTQTLTLDVPVPYDDLLFRDLYEPDRDLPTSMPLTLTITDNETYISASADTDMDRDVFRDSYGARDRDVFRNREGERDGDRTYTVRRHFDADGQETVHRIDMNELLERVDADVLRARASAETWYGGEPGSTLRWGDVANAGAGANTNVSGNASGENTSASANSGGNAADGASLHDIHVQTYDWPAFSSPEAEAATRRRVGTAPGPAVRRRRGWARLNADGDEIPTDEEEELERTRTQRRTQHIPPHRTAAFEDAISRVRMEYLAPGARAVIANSYAGMNADGVYDVPLGSSLASLPSPPPMRWVPTPELGDYGSPVESAYDAPRTGATAATYTAQAGAGAGRLNRDRLFPRLHAHTHTHPRPHTHNHTLTNGGATNVAASMTEYGSDEPFRVNPLPMPLAEMVPRNSSANTNANANGKGRRGEKRERRGERSGGGGGELAAR